MRTTERSRKLDNIGPYYDHTCIITVSFYKVATFQFLDLFDFLSGGEILRFLVDLLVAFV